MRALAVLGLLLWPMLAPAEVILDDQWRPIKSCWADEYAHYETHFEYLAEGRVRVDGFEVYAGYWVPLSGSGLRTQDGDFILSLHLLYGGVPYHGYAYLEPDAQWGGLAYYGPHGAGPYGELTPEPTWPDTCLVRP